MDTIQVEKIPTFIMTIVQLFFVVCIIITAIIKFAKWLENKSNQKNQNRTTELQKNKAFLELAVANSGEDERARNFFQKMLDKTNTELEKLSSQKE